MLTDWDIAQQWMSTADTLARIGEPVAAHVIWHAPSASEATDFHQAICQAVCRWLRDEPARMAEQRDNSGTVTHSLLTTTAGKTGLVSTGPLDGQPAQCHAILFGSRGTICWQDSRSSASFPQIEPPPSQPVRPAAKPPYGVLLVAGDHTHQPMYAQAFREDQRCRLVGLTDELGVSAERQSLNAQLAARLQIPLLPDLESALARDDVHVVSVCAEPYRRGPIAARAATCEKHLYLDKPLAGSTEHADLIVKAVEQAGVLAHMFSSLPMDYAKRIRQLLLSRELGRLLAIHCDFCFAKGNAGTAEIGRARHESPAPDRFELRDAKRELTNIGVYPLTLIASLLGTSIYSVTAATGNFFFAEHQRRDMEDFGQIMMRFQDGTIATCTTGRTGWYSHPKDGLNRTVLIGQRASAVVDANVPRAEVWSGSPAWQAPPTNPGDPMGMWLMPPDSPYRPAPKPYWHCPPMLSPQADAAMFLDCLERGVESPASVQVAATATEVLLAAYRSAASGQTVHLPLDRS